MCRRISGEYLQGQPILSNESSQEINAKPLEVNLCSDQYGPDWLHILQSIQNGGHIVCHKDHNFSKQGNGGYAEKVVGMILAVLNGKRVVFLPEKTRGCKHPDIKFDGLTWDIKYINFANCDTIRKYIRNGRKADNVVFYWDSAVNRIADLKVAVARSVGQVKNRTYSLPGIWYLNETGILKNILPKKSSEPLL